MNAISHSFTNFKELENKKLVIKGTVGTKAAIHFKPYKKPFDIANDFKQLPYSTRIQGDFSFWVSKKEELDFTVKSSFSEVSEKKEPGEYWIRYAGYEEDSDRVIMHEFNTKPHRMEKLGSVTQKRILSFIFRVMPSSSL